MSFTGAGGSALHYVMTKRVMETFTHVSELILIPEKRRSLGLTSAPETGRCENTSQADCMSACAAPRRENGWQSWMTTANAAAMCMAGLKNVNLKECGVLCQVSCTLSLFTFTVCIEWFFWFKKNLCIVFSKSPNRSVSFCCDWQSLSLWLSPPLPLPPPQFLFCPFSVAQKMENVQFM